MADAIAAKGMFYINASVTNTHTEDRLAEIVIRDNSDILFRDQGWMVHVTRFNVSTQQSLHFMDKDPDVYITFRYENEYFGNAVRQSTWRATENVNTLASFLAQINDAIPVMDHTGGAAPVATFSVTQDGKFLLKTFNTFNLGPIQYLGIQPSPKLMTLLGWDNATLNISFQASTDLRTRQYIRWYEKEFPKLREQYLQANGPAATDWSGTHTAMIEYFMWHFCNAQGILVANHLQAYAPGQNLQGSGPGGLVQDQPAYPYTDQWTSPRTRGMDITCFFHQDPGLVGNDSHGRTVGIYHRNFMSVAGQYHLTDSRTAQIAVIPLAGNANNSRMVLCSDVVMGDICEMRMVAMATNRRYIRVGRAPFAGAHTDRWGRFARIGDSVYLSYVPPANANAFDEAHMVEYKIVRIVEVDPAQTTEWGPGPQANHHAYNGRQQDLYLDNPCPLPHSPRLVNLLAQVANGNINVGHDDFYGERVLIGTRRMPGDPMRDVHTVNSVMPEEGNEWALQFLDEAWTWVVDDVVVGPAGQKGIVSAADLSSNVVYCTWPSYEPLVGDDITHFAAKEVFDAVWAEDCRNLRAMNTLTKSVARSPNCTFNGVNNQARWIQVYTERDEILRNIITRPNVRNWNVAKETRESFFAHQANIRGLNPGQALTTFYSTTARTVPAADYALLPYAAFEDNYWPSATFSILCDDDGGDWDTYFDWLSDNFGDGETYLIDSGPRIRFLPGVPGTRSCHRGQVGNAIRLALIIDVIPSSRSTDGKNRILCSFTMEDFNFVKHNFWEQQRS